MTRRRSFATALVVATLGLVALTACSRGNDAVVVFAASSLTDVLTDAELDLDFVFAGSSTLVAQLREGAAADLLITADESTMARAVDDGSVEGEPQAFTTNSLVLAVAPGNPAGVEGITSLSDADLVVGVCAPEVPCGALARVASEALNVDLAVDTEEPNVRALAGKLALGEVDAGLVYATDARALDLATVPVPGLDDHVTTYLVATVDAEPSAEVREALTELLAGTTVRGGLTAAGFGATP